MAPSNSQIWRAAKKYVGDLVVIQRLALALAIGLLFGVERGWQDREKKPGSRAAGIRTFASIGLLGGVWGLLAPLGSTALGLAALGFAGGFTVFELREARAAGSSSATGLVAGFLAFALGAYAACGNATAAGAAAVAATFVLAERQVLHAFLERMTWEELRSALLLLVMTFVLLPLLPDRAVDPWHVVNPYQVWLLSILIAALSYAGYVSVRLAGSRNGLLFAGSAGGLVSSTTVTWTFSRMAKQHPENSAEALGGILASWSVSFLRVVLVGFVIAPTLGNLLGKTLFGAMFILLAASGFFYWRASQRADPTALILKDPFELAVVLRFAAVFIAVLFAVKFASRLFGDGGIISVSAISGAVDVDPILLSLAQGVSHGAQHQTAARAILVAVAANTFFKCGLSAFFGGLRIASTLIGIGVVAIGTAAMAFRFFG